MTSEQIDEILALLCEIAELIDTIERKLNYLEIELQ